MSYSTEAITYCVSSHPCGNTECQRHRVYAPTDVIGVSVSDLWATCGIKREVKLPYPQYRPVAA